MNAFRTPVSMVLAWLFVFYRRFFCAEVVAREIHRLEPAPEDLAKARLRAPTICSGFSSTPTDTGWVQEDCINVWNMWISAAHKHQFYDFRYREIFNETATELQQRGSPCLTESYVFADGVGSSTLRHLATWMFSEEMGCDWIKPRLPNNGAADDGTALYCHSTDSDVNYKIRVGEVTNYPSGTPCLMTNWMVYFRYREHAVVVSNMRKAKTAPVRKILLRGCRDTLAIGLANAEK